MPGIMSEGSGKDCVPTNGSRHGEIDGTIHCSRYLNRRRHVRVRSDCRGQPAAGRAQRHPFHRIRAFRKCLQFTPSRNVPQLD